MANSDKISVFALIVSLGSFFFSWWSSCNNDKQSEKAFNKNYRPYISASNFAQNDPKSGMYINDIQTTVIKVFNAPAYIRKVSLQFYIRSNNQDSLLFAQPEINDEYFYPIENTQFTLFTDTNIVSDYKFQRLQPKEVIRKIKIDYEWISDNTQKYFFKAEWIYDRRAKNWLPMPQQAN